MKNLSQAAPSEFFNRDGHLHDEAAALYVDALQRNLVMRLPEAVVAHVDGCFLCKENLFALHEVLPKPQQDSLGPHPFLDAPMPAKRSFMPQLLRLAAVLAVSAVAIYTLAQLRARNASHSSPVTLELPRSDSTRSAVRDTLPLRIEAEPSADLYAANFIAAPDLESLLEAETRAADFVALSPKNDTLTQNNIVFAWQSEVPEALQLQILDNRETIIFEKARISSPFSFQEKLMPGVYYWKITSAEELLYVGKFWVGRRP